MGKKHNIWLIVGIGLIAVLLGYLVAVSSTSTISAVVAAIFGLVATAIGLITNSALGGKLDALIAAPVETKSSELVTAMTGIRSQLTLVPMLTGIALTVFAVSFFGGSYVGTSVRLHSHSWFSVSPASALPWPAASPTTSSDHAAAWLNIQQKMLTAGCSEAQVQTLYRIQETETKGDAAALAGNDTRLLARINGLTVEPAGGGIINLRPGGTSGPSRKPVWPPSPQ